MSYNFTSCEDLNDGKEYYYCVEKEKEYQNYEMQKENTKECCKKSDSVMADDFCIFNGNGFATCCVETSKKNNKFGMFHTNVTNIKGFTAWTKNQVDCVYNITNTTQPFYSDKITFIDYQKCFNRGSSYKYYQCAFNKTIDIDTTKTCCNKAKKIYHEKEQMCAVFFDSDKLYDCCSKKILQYN